MAPFQRDFLRIGASRHGLNLVAAPGHPQYRSPVAAQPAVRALGQPAIAMWPENMSSRRMYSSAV
jgi:hypothetical protein